MIGLLLLLVSCGGPPDPVEQLKKNLSSAPDYMIVLEDMREEGSFFTSYYHRYKVTQGDREATTNWIEVPESVYTQYQPFLGMALAAKSNEGVNDTPHPPGYQYVGNPTYGSWQQGSGGSFWVFYGQYSLMRNMMGWGGRRVYQSDYGDYQSSRNQRRPYYGKNREFGTAGSVTKQQKPTFFERRKQRIASRKQSFAQKVRSRTGRSRSGFGSRRGGFGK
jgi:hypothetical protein